MLSIVSRITVLQLAGMYSDLVFLWLAMSELSDSISRVRCLTNLSIYGGRTNRLAPDLEAVSTSSAAQFSYAAATDTCTVSSGLSAMHTLAQLKVSISNRSIYYWLVLIKHKMFGWFAARNLS
jgi:hypothetical protein